MSKPVIKKPEMPNRDIVERSAYIISGDNRHSTELSYQAGIDYCYKEMLGQFIEWGNLICEEHPNEPARRGFRWFFKHDCPKCWEALSQLEEDNK